QGARYQTHWAFQAPTRPAQPRVSNESWVRNPIDRFILARLEAEKLAPTPEADRATLIRRVTLDLTGLPPTPEEVDAFLADPHPDAYERLVDRLLNSPRYGERMALDWLDAARYADTHGYHIDSGRDMTRWRDWVIDSFNRNLPYDRFTVEQLAGDLLPNATLEQKIASGFNRNHMITFEGGVIPEEYLTAYIVDRVNTTGTVWLGLTVACTQCHDHKYDPMTQKEFYQLYAFFNGVPEKGIDGSKGNASPMIKAPRPDEQVALARLDAAIASSRAELNGAWPEADDAQRHWEFEQRGTSAPTTWIVPSAARDSSKNGSRLTRDPAGIIKADGPNPAQETYSTTFTLSRGALSAIRFEVFPDPALEGNGPGRSVNGNIALTEVRLHRKSTGSSTAEVVPIKGVDADFSQQGYPAANAIDGNPTTAWAIFPQSGRSHRLHLVLATPLVVAEPTELTVSLEFASTFGQHQPGRYRVSYTDSADPLGRSALPGEVAAALKVEGSQRTGAQKQAIRDYFRSQVYVGAKPLQERIQRLTRERNELDARIPTTMVMASMTAPRDTFFLVRGQYDKKGEKVEANVPAFLPPLPENSSRDRLALARWLVDPRHPLVSRVTVNRLWQTIFGTGLVRTVEDFGSQGETPSHPELLDWLAVEFVSPEAGTTGWDVKALIRRMVTSSTYRQASRVSPPLVARDPENRLLARGPRVRLAAEFLRDQALAVSGLLNGDIGGKSVSPYQPTGLWEELMSREDGKNWTAQVYEQSHGRDLYRRTMYTFWKRTSPPPALATFDAPDRETCTVRRARTNTPLQALVLLNDPTYVEAARKLAERVMTEAGPEIDARIERAFRLCTARRPSARELGVLREVLSTDLARFKAEPAAARKLLSVGESPRKESLDPVEHAAWTTVASVILNLDEVLNKN
ncbi:MAG: DUF1549 and DUF1553 domain-containing protein, partial [Isosphaeraceae bacterium]